MNVGKSIDKDPVLRCRYLSSTGVLSPSRLMASSSFTRLNAVTYNSSPRRSTSLFFLGVQVQGFRGWTNMRSLQRIRGSAKIEVRTLPSAPSQDSHRPSGKQLYPIAIPLCLTRQVSGQNAPAALVLALSLALCLHSIPAAADGGEPRPVQSQDPLTRAAAEFKTLTRDLGMRPESPPGAQEKRGPRMQWHGRVFENFRNDALDAIPHEVRQNGESKSPLRRNQFGFNVSGPLLIPKLITNPKNTFFMVSYEAVRERISRASLHTIPTADQRNGDFSQTVDQAGNLLPIYDPATTSPNPAYNPSLPVSTSNLQYLRSLFPGNRIPADRLTPAVLQALSFYPEPNTDIGPFFQNNYFVNAPEIDTADGVTGKLERQFGERHRITSNSTISRGFLSAAKFFPTIASPTDPDQHFSTKRTELIYVFTANSRTVNSASFTVGSEVTDTGNVSESSFPIYELFGNYLSMGVGFPHSRNARNSFEFQDSITTGKDKHSFTLIARANHYQVNSFDPVVPSGYFEFSTGLTGLPGITNTGDPFASFLLGLPQYGERTITTAPSYFRDSYQAVSLTDKYNTSKDFTLSATLNLSRRTPRTEKYDRQSTVDPAVINPSNGLPGALVFAGRDGIPRGLRPGSIDLDPTLSIAWNPFHDSKTVVRASYSRLHKPIPIYNGQWATQGFNARQTLLSTNTQLSPAFDFAAGIPPFTTPLPDISPAAADNTWADFVDMSRREPVIQSASVSVEREVPFSMVISVGTNHSDGHDMLVGDGNANPNAVDPRFLNYGNALYNEAFRDSLAPFPQYKGFTLYSVYPAGRYQRDAGFVRVEKHASFGLTFTAYYEFSKQFDDYSGLYGNQDLVNLRNNWSRSYYYPPQYLQLSYVYELPFGANDSLGWARPLARGWSVSGTVYWNDGTPLVMHPEFNNTGGVLSTLYVNVVPGVDPHVANPGPSLWYNPGAFDQPPDFTLGNGPRTMPDLLGPGHNSMDVSVTKRLPVGGGRALEFSAAAFDLLNHANWNYPDTTIGPASAPNINAGRIIGSKGGRVVQVGLKLSF